MDGTRDRIDGQGEEDGFRKFDEGHEFGFAVCSY
jgi:hypothetical protein